MKRKREKEREERKRRGDETGKEAGSVGKWNGREERM